MSGGNMGGDCDEFFITIGDRTAFIVFLGDKRVDIPNIVFVAECIPEFNEVFLW